MNKYEKMADLFKVLANPKRLEILNLLDNKEMNVTELVNKLGIRKANVSQHLAILRYLGIVTVKREGKKGFYKLVDPKIKQILDLLSKLNK